MRTVVPSRLPLWVVDMQGYGNTSWLACGYIETQCTPYSVTLYIVLYQTWTVARYMEHAGLHKSNDAVGDGTPTTCLLGPDQLGCWHLALWCL